MQFHNTGTGAEQNARNALLGHGTYRDHYGEVCTQIANELEKIEKAFRTIQVPGQILESTH